MQNIPKRTVEGQRKNFITCPGDVYLVPLSKYCISSGMTIVIVNEERGENIRLTCDNKPEVWDILRKLDDMGGREVFMVMDDVRTPFKESPAYAYRFGKQGV